LRKATRQGGNLRYIVACLIFFYVDMQFHELFLPFLQPQPVVIILRYPSGFKRLFSHRMLFP
jgi:hypothetical protein